MKKKREYPLDFKTMFGVSTMGFMGTVAYYLYTAVLMMYITDYAGIYKGVPGKAAMVATMLLFVARIWDAVNDLLVGYIVDISPITRWGKFKPFVFSGNVASGILAILLFNIPGYLSDTGKIIYLYVVYLSFTVAYTMIALRPLTAALSDEPVVRSRLIVLPRITGNIVGVVFAFFLAIASWLGHGTPDIPKAVILITVPFLILSLIGTVMVKEKNQYPVTERLRVKDFVQMFKVNRPFVFSLLITFLGGFVWALLNASVLYYIKYAFGIKNLAVQTSIFGIVVLVSMILGALLAEAVMKKVSPIKGMILSYSGTIPPLLILWVVNRISPVQNVWLFYGLLFIALVSCTAGYVPGSLMNMEAMDYNRYKLGRGMEGIVNAAGTFVEKFQSGIAVIITGSVLTAIGYDAALYEKAAVIPDSLLRGLGDVLFGFPALFALICVIVCRFYPLKDAEREAMYQALEKEKQIAEQEEV